MNFGKASILLYLANLINIIERMILLTAKVCCLEHVCGTSIIAKKMRLFMLSSKTRR